MKFSIALKLVFATWFSFVGGMYILSTQLPDDMVAIPLFVCWCMLLFFLMIVILHLMCHRNHGASIWLRFAVFVGISSVSSCVSDAFSGRTAGTILIHNIVQRQSSNLGAVGDRLFNLRASKVAFVDVVLCSLVGILGMWISTVFTDEKGRMCKREK
ncbi:MAG: hypothetical protein AAGA30_05945 [Planctomycetota bacterium]